VCGESGRKKMKEGNEEKKNRGTCMEEKKRGKKKEIWIKNKIK